MRKASLLILFLTVFVDLIGFGMVIPFLSFYAREYGASGFVVGAIAGVYSIMQFFFTPFWGRLSDRIGRRPVLIISLCASCAGYFLFAFSRGLWLLFASRVIAGVGGGNVSTAQAYIADSTTPENRAKGMGLIGAAFGMGFILGPPLSGILAAVGTRRGLPGNLLPGLAAATLSLIALVMAIVMLGESRRGDATLKAGLPPQFDPRVWRQLGQHRMIALIMVALFLTLLAVAGMETSVTLHARDRFGFRQLDLAWFLLFMGVIVAGIQGGLIGRLARAVGERLLVAIGAVAFTVGLALVPAIQRVPLLYLAALLIAIGQGLCYPALTSLLSKVVSSEERGTMLGLASGIGALARFLGPILTGVLYDAAGVAGAFLAGAAFTLLAFFAAIRLPPRDVAVNPA